MSAFNTVEPHLRRRAPLVAAIRVLCVLSERSSEGNGLTSPIVVIEGGDHGFGETTASF